MPRNVTNQDLHVFESQLSYKSLYPKIKFIKNAFITNTGLVCSNKGFIKECCHYEWDQQPEVCFAQACEFYYDAKEDSRKLILFDDDETYLVAHNPWHHNYFHWLNEAIYRLWLVKEISDQMILLLPPKEKLSSFVLDTLEIFKFKDIIHIPDQKSVMVRTLCLPSQKPTMDRYNAVGLLDLNNMYLNRLIHKGIQANAPKDRVYISRKNARWRRIVNEDSVIELLTTFDFVVVDTEKLTFYQQVALFSNVKVLISSHGAGLTNMLFMRPGTTVFEFHKRKTNPIRHQNVLFWRMADAMGHNYYHQICEPTDHNEMFFTADISVDIDSLERCLNSIFSIHS